MGPQIERRLRHSSGWQNGGKMIPGQSHAFTPLIPNLWRWFAMLIVRLLNTMISLISRKHTIGNDTRCQLDNCDGCKPNSGNGFYLSRRAYRPPTCGKNTGWTLWNTSEGTSQSARSTIPIWNWGYLSRTTPSGKNNCESFSVKRQNWFGRRAKIWA
jgi:hypothetical protein